MNRVIRDIPSNHVEIRGARSLRQDALAELAQHGGSCRCVRCREVRGQLVKAEQLMLQDLVYPAGYAEEHFLSFVTPEDQIAGYLRLSLPGLNSPTTGLTDLEGAAWCARCTSTVNPWPSARTRLGRPGTAAWARLCCSGRKKLPGQPVTVNWRSSELWHPWLLCQPRLHLRRVVSCEGILMHKNHRDTEEH